MTKRNNKKKRKFPYRKTVDLEADICDQEAAIETLHEQMLEPENLRDGRRMKELGQQLADCEARLLTLYEHYEEACEFN